MTAPRLKVGDRGIDFSGFRLDTATKIAQAQKAGVKFVIRYSAGAASATSHPSHASVAWKLITPAEHAQLRADGFDVVANSEWYESRITEGELAGREDGAADLALWRSCGHAKGATIYVSLDQAPPAKADKVAAYFVGYALGLGGYYAPDLYGGTPLLRALIKAKAISKGWRPNAGSWSNDGLPYQPNTSSAVRRLALVARARLATPAHLWQTGNYMFGKDADEDMVVRTPVGSHFDAVRAAEKTKPRLRRKWPVWAGPHDYFGAVQGGGSHNGTKLRGRGAVRAIQKRLIALGLLKKGLATGRWSPATTAAVEAWHAKHMPTAQHKRVIGHAAWLRLFTY